MILGGIPIPLPGSFHFFPTDHLSYTRIDFYLIDYRTMFFVSNSQYHSITVSDHCPAQLDMSFPNSSIPQHSWQLDPLLLTQGSFEKCNSDQIDFFLLTNTTPGMSYATISESLKAHLRGQIISYAAYKKRERTKRLKE